jgi:hypothetical protein
MGELRYKPAQIEWINQLANSITNTGSYVLQTLQDWGIRSIDINNKTIYDFSFEINVNGSGVDTGVITIGFPFNIGSGIVNVDTDLPTQNNDYLYGVVNNFGIQINYHLHQTCNFYITAKTYL